MELIYLDLDDTMISEVVLLFDNDNQGGTSSISLNASLRGEGHSEVLVCVLDRVLVGALEFSLTEDSVARIRNVVVKENLRNQGVASLLLKGAEEKIISDYQPFCIKTIPMPLSYKLFEKFGYVPDRNSEHDWYKQVCS